MGTDKRQYLWLSALFTLLVVSCYVRLETADQRMIWYDETYTRELAGFDTIPEILERSRSDWAGETPPLHYITCWLHFRVSQSLLSLRLPSVESGVLAVLALAVLGSLMFSRSVGLISGGLMALSVYHIEYSQDARAYSLQIFFIVATFLCLFAFLEKGRWRWFPGFVLAAAASMYTHFFSTAYQLCIFITIGCILLARIRDHGKGEEPVVSWKSLLAFTLLAYLLIGLLFLPILSQFTGFLSRNTPPATHALNLSPRFFQELIGRWGNGSLWSPAYAICLLSGIAATLRRRDATLSLVLWLAVPFVAFSLVGLQRVFDIRYLIGALPAFFLLVGAGIVSIASLAAGLLRRVSRSAGSQSERWRLAVAGAVFAFFTVLSIDTYRVFRVTDTRCSQFFMNARLLQAHDGFCSKHLILNTLHPEQSFILRERRAPP